MQKLAVALTTQEEFNEYMTHIDNTCLAKGKRVMRCGNDAWSWHGENTCMELNGEYTKIMHIYGAEENGYKIISLQEAIGEENKEIIREGEARGLEPKTGDWVMVSDYDNSYTKELYLCTNQESDYKYICVTENTRQAYLDGENFECRSWKFIKPIEETKREGRIDKVITSVMPYLFNINEDVLWDNVIREAIEKHMPRISEKELDNISWELKTVQQEKRVTNYGELLELLKSKGLLE